jgi:hypothetical protein
VRENVSRVLLFLDTCHAGAIELSTRGVNPGEDLAETLKESEGTYIFSASKAGEESLESPAYKYLKEDPGHGVFSYCLLEGLSGGKADLDEDFRLRKISRQGDPLEILNKFNDWEIFKRIISKIFKKEPKGPGGRPRFDYILMFKIKCNIQTQININFSQY